MKQKMKAFFVKGKNRTIAFLPSVAMVLYMAPSFSFSAFAAVGDQQQIELSEQPSLI